MDNSEIWGWLVEQEIVTESELTLAINLCGYSRKTLLDVLDIQTGYSSIEAYKESIEG